MTPHGLMARGIGDDSDAALLKLVPEPVLNLLAALGLPHLPPGEAACAGQWDIMWPEVKKAATSRAAKAVCNGCSIRVACLEAVLSRPDKTTGGGLPGIWGGTTEMERRRLRREQRSAA